MNFFITLLDVLIVFCDVLHPGLGLTVATLLNVMQNELDKPPSIKNRSHTDVRVATPTGAALAAALELVRLLSTCRYASQ